MKKFYEAPVVELTGFSAEDVITTSVPTIDTVGMTKDQAEAIFEGYNAVNSYADTGSYTW